MQKRLLLSFIGIIAIITSYSQQLPSGACGLVNVYDVNGNRKLRRWFCNDGNESYPLKNVQNEKTEKLETSEVYQPVEALYPNPTTGKFVVTFSNEQKNAKVMLLDINGKIVQQHTGNGFMLNFDLSNFASGVYFLRIENKGKVFTKKVIKQ